MCPGAGPYLTQTYLFEHF